MLGEASMTWIVSVPVWGAPYVRIFEGASAPALLAAVSRLGGTRVKFIIHTSAAEEARVRAALPGQDVEVRFVGDNPTYVALQNAHADALASADLGDYVVLLNADLVVSGNLLMRCAYQFSAGVQAVVMLGIRTVIGPEWPPAGAPSRDLLQWAWGHRHVIIRDLEWPDGRSMVPTYLFFGIGESVVARGFHLHPVAVVKRGDISFKSTIDGDLLDAFPRDRIHVVTDPDDCAMCEISQPERRFPVRDMGGMTSVRVAASMEARASPTHCWLFTHRIGVVGPVCDCGDEAVAREVLENMGQKELMQATGAGTAAQVGGRRGRDPHGRRGTQSAGRRVPGSPADILP